MSCVTSGRRNRLPRDRRGFTLIELLVVVAVIALLISILVPSLQRSRKQAQAVRCQANLHDFGPAFKTFAEEMKGYYPGSIQWFGRPRYWYGVPDHIATFSSPQASSDGWWKEGLIFEYVGRSLDVYICPSDDGKRYYDADESGPGGAGQPYSAQLLIRGRCGSSYCMQKPLQQMVVDSTGDEVNDEVGVLAGMYPPPDPRAYVYYKESLLFQTPSKVILLAEQSEDGAFNDARVGWEGSDLYLPAINEALTTRHLDRSHLLMFDGHVRDILSDEQFNEGGVEASRNSGLLYDVLYYDPIGTYGTPQSPQPDYRIRSKTMKTADDKHHSWPS